MNIHFGVTLSTLMIICPYRVQNLEDWIENSSSHGSSSKADESFQQLKTNLDTIRNEIESCKGCWEESSNQVERYFGQDSSSNKPGMCIVLFN